MKSIGATSIHFIEKERNDDYHLAWRLDTRVTIADVCSMNRPPTCIVIMTRLERLHRDHDTAGKSWKEGVVVGMRICT